MYCNNINCTSCMYKQYKFMKTLSDNNSDSSIFTKISNRSRLAGLQSAEWSRIGDGRRQLIK